MKCLRVSASEDYLTIKLVYIKKSHAWLLLNTYSFCTSENKELCKQSLHVHTQERDSLKYQIEIGPVLNLLLTEKENFKH